MTQLTLTFAAGTHAGAQIRMLAHRLKEAALEFPDNPQYALTVVFDNAPGGASASVQVTSTPMNSALKKV